MAGLMKIAFYGSSLLSSYWNGAATYYRGLLGALARLGHGITFYEPDAFDRQSHRDIEPPDWARVVVYPATVPGVPWQREVGPHDTLRSIDKARRVLGYDPRHSWRDPA